jgi:acyltransferase
MEDRPRIGSPPSNRILWIDTLKGIGVTFVVIGHTVGVSPLVLKLIFSFHIPLFFWMSGLVSTGKVRTMSVWSVVKDRARRRLIPYLGFALISYLLWVSFLRFYGTRQVAGHIGLWIPLVGIFYGANVHDFLAPNVVLWFFPCLFTAEVFFAFFVRINSRLGLLSALMVSSVFGYLYTSHFAFRFPWGADVALTAVVFYGFGYLARPYILKQPPSRKFFGAALLVCFTIYVAFSLLNTDVAIIIGNYGDNYFFFYAAALAGIVSWALVSDLISGNRILNLVGRHTLVIFSLHLLVFPFITAFFLYALKMPPGFREQSVVYAIVYTVVSIAVLVPVSILIGKFFPTMLGKFPTRRKREDLPEAIMAVSMIEVGEVSTSGKYENPAHR